MDINGALIDVDRLAQTLSNNCLRREPGLARSSGTRSVGMRSDRGEAAGRCGRQGSFACRARGRLRNHAGENFRLGPPQQSAHTGEEFRRGKGLDEIVVRSGR